MSDEIEALLTENRRLRAESRRLGERLAAVERSRWWRLHPRFLMRRGGRSDAALAEERRTDSLSVNEPAHEKADSVATRFREEVVAAGVFSEDWFTEALPRLDGLVRPLAGRRAEILEIGSYEGLSTCYFLWRVRDARLTCVDTFAWSLDHRMLPPDARLEAAFDHNVGLLDASRVRKLVGDSRRVLLDLVEEDVRFDLIYVDGSHLALDVIVDAAFAWRLLAKDGTIVFDDYAWTDIGEDPLLRPGRAVDAVLWLLEGKYEVLFRDAQVALRKTL